MRHSSSRLPATSSAGSDKAFCAEGGKGTTALTLRLSRTCCCGSGSSPKLAEEPNKVCCSEACHYGLGGYSISGRAWRLQIPKTSPIFGHKGINNLLKLLGMAINIWLSCLKSNGDKQHPGHRRQHIGDWLAPQLVAVGHHLKVARKIAMLKINFQCCCLASQHFKGELNVVADILSFTGGDTQGKAHPIEADLPANDKPTVNFLTCTRHRCRRTSPSHNCQQTYSPAQCKCYKSPSHL